MPGHIDACSVKATQVHIFSVVGVMPEEFQNLKKPVYRFAPKPGVENNNCDEEYDRGNYPIQQFWNISVDKFDKSPLPD